MASMKLHLPPALSFFNWVGKQQLHGMFTEVYCVNVSVVKTDTMKAILRFGMLTDIYP